jgi:hypothetical protein
MTVSGAVKSVVMIPAATEWAYAPFQVYRDVEVDGAELVQTENGFSSDDARQRALLYAEAAREGLIGSARCDWKTSLDTLQAELYSVGRVNLFVSWYGDSLDCGSCQVYPAVTRNSFDNMPEPWSVAGVTRGAARLLSTSGGSAAYGGTPSDDSVVAAIRDMHARGLAVTFTPFLLLDVPAGNGLTNPYTGAAGQPAYPWRGRITCGYGMDNTSTGADQAAAFAARYRTFVLHCASLCASAGGVDAFVLGSELRGLTWLRYGGGHPFVAALVSLAAEVRAILPNAKLTYAADWSEFTPYQNGGDLTFHLDPLWAVCDAIGIDAYWPLSDWRDGTAHADYASGWRDPHSLDYLQANIRGGEGYHWYYASDGDRASQIRTAISDWYGKPWVYRTKDIWGWWSNPHYDRTGGAEAGSPTAWVPESKPIWFTELGCPAVDKGANQPNVFHDAKSSESAYPYFSSGARDDRMQGRYLAAMLRYFDPASPGFDTARNPTSPLYSGRMVDPERLYVYCWDARPYPWFPYGSMQVGGGAPFAIWADGVNYETGHWIMGRADLADLLGVATTDASPAAVADADGSAPYSMESTMAGLADLELINTALVRIGGDTLQSFGSPNGPEYLAIYNAAIGSLCSRYPWTFVQSFQQLARLAAVPVKNRWKYGYALPSDMAGTPLAVYDTINADLGGSPVTNFEIFGGILYANLDQLWMRYIQQPNPQRWPGYFREMAIKLLMAEYAIPVREDAALRAKLMLELFGPPDCQAEEGLMGEAKANDSKGRPSRTLQIGVNPLVSVRFT